MSIWIILISMVGGALISEMYHARMWKLYRQGKNEGREYSQDMQDMRPSIEIRRTSRKQ